MNPVQLMVSDVLDIVSETTFRMIKDEISSVNDSVEAVLGVTNAELSSILFFIMDVMPQSIYLNSNEGVKNYVISIISREIILFLSQEDKTSHEFQQNLKNFRDEMVDEVVNNTYVK